MSSAWNSIIWATLIKFSENYHSGSGGDVIESKLLATDDGYKSITIDHHELCSGELNSEI